MRKRMVFQTLALVTICLFFSNVALAISHQNEWCYPAVSTGTSADFHGYKACIKYNKKGECILKGYHVGIDFNNNQGDPVYAIAHGEIIDYDSNLSFYGSWCPSIDYEGAAILVKHMAKGHDGFSRPFYAVYGHNTINSKLKPGDIVEKGEIIGTTHYFWGPTNLCEVGKDGRRDWSHLHFGIRPDEIDSSAPFRGVSSSLKTDNGWTDPIPFLDDNYPGFWENISCEKLKDKYPKQMEGKSCLDAEYEPPNIYYVWESYTPDGGPLAVGEMAIVTSFEIEGNDLNVIGTENRIYGNGYGGGGIPDDPNPPTASGDLKSLFRSIKVSKKNKDKWKEELTLGIGEKFDGRIKFYEYKGSKPFKAEMKFYLSKDKHFDKDDDRYLGKDKCTVKPGEAEKEYIKNEKVPESWGEGNFYLFCYVKWEGGNKWYCKEYATIKIRKPELVMTDLSVYNKSSGEEFHSPSTAFFEGGGQEVAIRATVKNTGYDISDKTDLRYWLIPGVVNLTPENIRLIPGVVNLTP
ncbi:MAG: M23 family metallopeptidase, partial [Desulfococcaceae bacterium]|nr:M23 family metallopeptidase [Desulfococcaceae bacterium]